MASRLALLLLLAVGGRGCVVYEFEHEFWLKVDGSGSVNVTGRPALWTRFKGLSAASDESLREKAWRLFVRSGLDVRRVTVTRRGGQRYLFVAADFADVNRLGGSPAFPDLRISLQPSPSGLRLSGRWAAPPDGASAAEGEGLLAVRFHVPSKVYGHDNADAGVERGNILSWSQTVAAGLEGRTLAFGATLDRRSILWSTVGLFAGSIAGALALLAATLLLVRWRGQRLAREATATAGAFPGRPDRR